MPIYDTAASNFDKTSFIYVPYFTDNGIVLSGSIIMSKRTIFVSSLPYLPPPMSIQPPDPSSFLPRTYSTIFHLIINFFLPYHTQSNQQILSFASDISTSLIIKQNLISSGSRKILMQKLDLASH